MVCDACSLHRARGTALRRDRMGGPHWVAAVEEDNRQCNPCNAQLSGKTYVYFAAVDVAVIYTRTVLYDAVTR